MTTSINQFTLYFKTERPSSDAVVVRTSVEDWTTDLRGRWLARSLSWRFELLYDSHPPGTTYKFYVPAEDVWGPRENLIIPVGAISQSFVEDDPSWFWG